MAKRKLEIWIWPQCANKTVFGHVPLIPPTTKVQTILPCCGCIDIILFYWKDWKSGKHNYFNLW